MHEEEGQGALLGGAGELAQSGQGPHFLADHQPILTDVPFELAKPACHQGQFPPFSIQPLPPFIRQPPGVIHQLVHGQFGQVLQRAELDGRRRRMRACVADGQKPDDGAVRRGERRAGEKPHVDLGQRLQMMDESPILPDIGRGQGLGPRDHHIGEGSGPGILLSGNPDAGLVPEPVAVDENDRRARRSEQGGRQTNDAVESRVAFRIHGAKSAQDGQAVFFRQILHGCDIFTHRVTIDTTDQERDRWRTA